MCVVYTVDHSTRLSSSFGEPLTRWGRLSGEFWLSFSSQWIFLAGCPLFCGIIYLGMAGGVDVSQPVDSVSEHGELVSIVCYY